MIHKICIKCGTKYPATTVYFYKSSSAKDGLRPRCKRCMSIYAKQRNQTEQGKIVQKRAMKKYYHTECGGAAMRQRRKNYCSTLVGMLRQTFHNMKSRCVSQDHYSYKNYGGRGIKCLFISPDEFIDYVINTLCVDPRGLTIDRIDNNGHYERGNIRFVTAKENQQNKGR